MEISGAETASSRELTINEKLLQFRKKKDESRKENDIPQNKNSAPTKVQTYTSKVSSNKSNLSKPLEVRSNASKVFKFTCLPVVAQTIPVSTLRPQKEPIASTSKLVEMQAESRGRVLRTKSRIPTASEFKIKLEEYVMLAENAGIVVARSFISTVPSEVNMKDVEMQALYWLTWIRHEREAEQWEFVSSLFLRAKNTVKSLSGVQAILTAEQNFLEKFVPIQPSIHDNLIEAFEDKICNKSSSPLGSPVSNVVNDMEGDDVRLLMGEDGFTLGELSHPKALRFSIGDSKPQQILQDEGSCAKSSTLSSAHQIDAVKSTCHVGKYSNFIQSTQQPRVSTEAVVALSTAAGTSSIAAVSPLKVVPRSVSSHVAQLEDRLKVKPEADSQLTMAQPPSLSVGLLQASSFSPYGHKSIVQHMSSSKSLAKKSEKVKSPGGASLDILLGIGFYEEEGDDMLNSSSSLKGIRTSQNKSTPELHDVALGANLNKSTDTQSSAAVTVEIPVRAHRGHGRGRNEIEKISTGVNDIFRDDEDSSTGSEMIKATGCKSRVSTDTDTSSRKRVLVPDEVTTNVNSAFNSLSESLTASNPIQPYKRRATLRRAAVSFATEVLSISPKIVVRKFEEDFDSVIESLSNTVLDSGCRRSRRLSGSGSSVFSSGSKIKTKIIRRGTPHAANRPRFTRPLSRDSMGSRGSEGSTGGSSDYGSYFSSMEESPQLGDKEDGDFSLLEATPVGKERRSRRLSSAKR